MVRLYARQETPIPGIYLYRVGRRIRHRGYLTSVLAPFVWKTCPAAMTPHWASYGFATMSNSTRNSFFTFTAPPPTLIGSIPKSLCFSSPCPDSVRFAPDFQLYRWVCPCSVRSPLTVQRPSPAGSTAVERKRISGNRPVSSTFGPSMVSWISARSFSDTSLSMTRIWRASTVNSDRRSVSLNLPS